MATIYTDTHSGLIRTLNGTSATSTFTYDSGTTASTSTAYGCDLNKYLYTPATETNLARIKDTLNNYITTGVASGIYDTSDNYYTGTSDHIDATMGSYISDFKYSADSGTVDIEVNVALSEEEQEKIEKEQKILCKKQEMKNNLLIKVKSRARTLPKIPENEQIAMETLRESITEEEFRKYLTYGFVLVEGKGGKTFQVFRNRSHTKVWKGGKVIEEICVHLKDRSIPPTDHVIAFRAMIRADEEAFRKLGNVYNMRRAA